MRRDATHTIWKTVVFAGAMLGSACGGKAKPTTTPVATDPATKTAEEEEAAKKKAAQPADPCAAPADPCAAADDPCAWTDPCGEGRVRGGGEGGTGRGFILS